MENNIISYKKKTFSELREEIFNMIREYYPELLQDFSDSSLGSLLIDINAGVGNNLSINTDRAFQETQIDYAQQNRSIRQIAKTLGFNIGGRTPSITVIDFTVTVPVKGDNPDSDYYPQIMVGTQVIGGGQTFETQDIIDFNTPVSNLGDQNRAIIPNLNSNGIIESYKITKREIVKNGVTNIYRKAITETEVVPFYKLFLPDPDVLEIQDVILVPSTNITGNPSEEDWNNPEYRFYEVDYLAQQRIFIDNPNGGTNNLTKSNTGIKAGIWKETNKKFIKEYSDNGFCYLTFGNGNMDLENIKKCLLEIPKTNLEFLNNILSNRALGIKLKRDSTLFVRYRTGGGSQSNVGVNVLNSLGIVDIIVNGARADLNNQVIRSLKVTNPIPAIGGNSELNVEEIRNLVKYNYSSQYRDVTINDYLLQIFKIPGKFGSIFRANSFRENNKVVIPILSLDSGGKLKNVSNTILKENIAEYLTEFRMVNDYIEIRNGRIFNIALDVEVFAIDNVDAEIANSIITVVRDYFDIRNKKMNEDIFLAPLIEEINNVAGVINVLDIRIYNKVGGQYSVNPVSQEISDENTGRIRLINQTLYSEEDAMFEIKFPSKDIKVFIKKKTNLNI